MPKLREASRTAVVFLKATFTVFEIMSGGISIPLGVLALLNAWSARQAFAVIAYFALWATVISLAIRLRKLQEKPVPKLTPLEIIQKKLSEGYVLRDAIADVSAVIPDDQPKKWIDEALNCLRENAPHFVDRFKTESIPTRLLDYPKSFEGKPLTEWLNTGRNDKWQTLNDHLIPFEVIVKSIRNRQF